MKSTPKIKVDQENFLSQKATVVVTGASSGIGLAQVKAFLRKKFKVIGLDIQPFKDDQKKDPNFTFFLVDLTKKESLEVLVEENVKLFSDSEILCNTAGRLDGYANLEATDDHLWEEILANNLQTTFNMTKVLLPFLLSKPSSRIINMTSIAGLTAGGGGIAYTTAKHALVGFTKQLAYDFGKRGLRANGIAPGAIYTPMNQEDFMGEGSMARWVMDETPVGRWAQAEEVADLALFLASNQADYINGVIIPIDGGWLIR